MKHQLLDRDAHHLKWRCCGWQAYRVRWLVGQARCHVRDRATGCFYHPCIYNARHIQALCTCIVHSLQSLFLVGWKGCFLDGTQCPKHSCQEPMLYRHWRLLHTHWSDESSDRLLDWCVATHSGRANGSNTPAQECVRDLCILLLQLRDSVGLARTENWILCHRKC